jgi:hypothetical protein
MLRFAATLRATMETVAAWRTTARTENMLMNSEWGEGVASELSGVRARPVFSKTLFLVSRKQKSTPSRTTLMTSTSAKNCDNFFSSFHSAHTLNNQFW